MNAVAEKLREEAVDDPDAIPDEEETEEDATPAPQVKVSKIENQSKTASMLFFFKIKLRLCQYHVCQDPVCQDYFKFVRTMSHVCQEYVIFFQDHKFVGEN